MYIKVFSSICTLYDQHLKKKIVIPFLSNITGQLMDIDSNSCLLEVKCLILILHTCTCICIVNSILKKIRFILKALR